MRSLVDKPQIYGLALATVHLLINYRYSLLQINLFTEWIQLTLVSDTIKSLSSDLVHMQCIAAHRLKGARNVLPP